MLPGMFGQHKPRGAADSARLSGFGRRNAIKMRQPKTSISGVAPGGPNPIQAGAPVPPPGQINMKEGVVPRKRFGFKKE